MSLVRSSNVLPSAGSRNIALQSPAQSASKNAASTYVLTPFIDPNLDDVWGSLYNGQAPNPYFDYYFSGQDLKVQIDGIESDPVYGDLPINQFAFNITQKNMTFYGYNSYTYDAVARGNRIVNGTFSLYSRAPTYMMQAVALAAQNRSNTGPVYDTYTIAMTEDDANLQQYWGNNLDPTVAINTVNLFSTHPPFSFVVTYGIQDVSIGSNTNITAQNLQNSYSALNGDDLLALDINDRIVPVNPQSNLMRLVLNDCILTSMQQVVGSDGVPLFEVYSFFGRDIVYPS